MGAATRTAELLGDDAEYVVAAVYEAVEYDGTGFAGPTITEEEAEPLERERQLEAETAITQTVAAMELTAAEHRVLAGEPGPEICRLAEDEKVDVVAIATHAWGPVKRAVMGSVSDHVVRHAPCPVLVVGPEAAGEE